MSNADIYEPLIIEKLSESNLKEVLIRIFSEQINSQYCLKNNKRKFFIDYYIETNTHKIAIEFDGHYHYTQTKSQIRDIELTQLCQQSGIDLIRIPYWVQIDSRTLRYYFSKYTTKLPKIKSTYKHGFWDPKITYPADFNQYGRQLFESQFSGLGQFDSTIIIEIDQSLDSVDSRLSRGL
jgi:hypothetical protein